MVLAMNTPVPVASKPVMPCHPNTALHAALLRASLWALSALTLLSASLLGPQRALADATGLKVAPLGPRKSPWWQAFRGWHGSLKQETSGSLGLRLRAEGAGGDTAVLEQLKAKKLDAAALTLAGLAQIVPEVAALQAPGVLRSYESYRRALTELTPVLDAAFAEAGYVVLGWSHLGRGRMFSREPLDKPADFKGKTVAVLPGDPVLPAVLRSIPRAKSKRLAVDQAAAALQSGRIDVAPASALAALYLGWQQSARYVSNPPGGVLVSATLIRKSRFEALSDEQQRVLKATGARAHQWLRKTLRQRDDAAYKELLRGGLRVVDLAPHKRAWDRVAREARKRLVRRRSANRAFGRSWLKQVESFAGD